jgi:hypothetical protein
MKMKHNKRRASGGFPYFKLATFDSISMCFRDGRQAYTSIEQAYNAAKKPGRYRISIVDECGRQDLSEFEPCSNGRISHKVSELLGATYKG